MKKEEIIQFLWENNCICLGDFITKSGRKSPYFLNFGCFSESNKLEELGKFYAEFIKRKSKDITCIFGPSYKGIPLSLATIFSLRKKDVHYSFNRKEKKEHGDGGIIVGKKLQEQDKIVIVDDVITAGISIDEVTKILKKQGNPFIEFILVCVDRMEKSFLSKEDNGQQSALKVLSQRINIPIFSLVTVKDIFNFLKEKRLINTEQIEAINDYFSKYVVEEID